MAKTIKCAICGKEIVKGFLSGDAESLTIGKTTTIDCCSECREKYKKSGKAYGERFEAKIHNINRTKKKQKLTSEEIGRLFLKYCEEEESRPEASFDNYSDFYAYNDDGSFSVNEYKLGFLDQDIGKGSMLKSEFKNISKQGKAFTKDDITKIEYRRVGIFGSSAGLFRSVYSYEIRLNDESKFTYHPAITRTMVIGTHLPLLEFLSADKKMKKIMQRFKQNIGSDLPVVQVQKFSY